MPDAGSPYADTSDMYAAHDMFRREFALLPGLVRSGPAKDTDRAQVITGHISLVTIDGPSFTSQVLADAPGSVSVGQHGKTGWVLEGQLQYLFVPALKGKKPAPFIAQSVALP